MEEVKVHYIFSRHVLSDSIFANRKLKCSIGLALMTFWCYFPIWNRRLKAGRFQQKHIILTLLDQRFNMQSAELAFFSRRFGPFSSKAYHFDPFDRPFWYAIGKSILFLHTNRLEMIRNPVNWKFLGGNFGRFQQKHIISTLLHQRFNMQSVKAYYFRTRIALKWYAIRWIGIF